MIFLFCPTLAFGHVATFWVDVPFEFLVGKQPLPADSYVLQVVSGKHLNQGDISVVVLKTHDGRIYRAEVARVSGHLASRPQVSTLSFVRFEGKEYLTKVSLASNAVELEFASFAKNLGPNSGPSTELVLATYP